MGGQGKHTCVLVRVEAIVHGGRVDPGRAVHSCAAPSFPSILCTTALLTGHYQLHGSGR